MSYLMRIPMSQLKIKQCITDLYNICPLCRKIDRVSQSYLRSGIIVRQQATSSTKTSVLPTVSKKVKKKAKKEMYSDVIQVSDSNGSTAKQKLTLIKKTSSKKLLDGLSLTESKLGKIKVKDKAKVESSECGALPTLQNTMSDHPELRVSFKHVDLPATELQFFGLEPEPITSMQFERVDESHDSVSDASDEMLGEEDLDTCSKSNKISLKKEKRFLSKMEQEKTNKISADTKRHFTRQLFDNSTMAAYIDVCVNCNMTNQAHNALVAHRARLKSGKIKKLEIAASVYNQVLQAQAQKGNWTKAKELLFIMRNDTVKATLQTYATLFNCISRLPKKDTQIINNILKDIQKDGLDMKNMDRECVYSGDDRERILSVIHLVQPDFVPESIVIKEPYDGSLLNRLQEPVKKYRSYGKGLPDVSQLQFNSIQQMKLEVDGYLSVKSISKPSQSNTDQTINLKKVLDRLESNWRTAMTERFKKNVEILEEKLNRGKNGWNVNYYPFLSVLKPEEYVEIMMQEIDALAQSSESYSTPQSMLFWSIGNKVMQRYFAYTKEKNKVVNKILKVYKDYCKYQSFPNSQISENPREQWTNLLHINSKGPTLDYEQAVWPKFIQSKIGSFLYEIILNETAFDPDLLKSSISSNNSSIISATETKKILVFNRVYRKCERTKYVKEDIKVDPRILRLFKLAGKENLTFPSNILPMLVPPLPWTSIRSGGYLLSSGKFIRLSHSAMVQQLRLEDAPNKQFWPIFDSLNQLSECAWKINKPILDVIVEVFNNNGDESLDVPQPPLDVETLPKTTQEMSKEERGSIYKQRTTLMRRRAEMYSLWCDALYRLSIANHYRDETFWFSHNMDFRGRVYPCPPHFNHLGGDVARGLLLFSVGEPLGEKGLDWLKIHLINLTGLKKRESLSERLTYANEMMPEIIDSANNPLTGNRWWTKSDEPWQTLACCKEIVEASALPDPSSYICHFPIHQDGSCNGLQHYSALGRDALGAEQVNLLPKDKPEDVYTGVAQLVEIERAKDAANGVEIARVLEGYVRRKVIKQTVMTTVYGVTRFGARLQILKQLKALPDFPAEKQWVASLYLVQKTFQSIQKMFTATKEIQDWFTECARLVSNVCGQPIEWVTPLGLPVVQPYHRRATTKMKFSSEITGVESSDLIGKPNVMKQKNAFPPNYIHSLDSTHMMLTSLYCRQRGVAFVSVHDCFWTHPSTVEIMNKICREQFVALHSLPLLKELSTYFIEKYSYSDSDLEHDDSITGRAKKKLNRSLERVPATGDFQLENVLNSTYFFS